VPAEAPAGPAHCHAVLARLVEDPSRLGGPPDAGPVTAALDLQRVRQVTGFIAKVRHNPVRSRYPLTMRALAAAGIEIDFFADHAPAFTTRRRAGITDEARTALFVDALDHWLQPDDDARHRLVADVLAHERVLAELAGREPAAAPDVEAVLTPRSRPRRRDGVRILHLTLHPPDVGDGAAAESAIDRSPRCYAYVPTPAGPRARSLDPALAPLLELADGSRTVAGIAAAVGAADAVDLVVAVLEVVVRGGLADVVGP
jgi:hypothetical protein